LFPVGKHVHRGIGKGVPFPVKQGIGKKPFGNGGRGFRRSTVKEDEFSRERLMVMIFEEVLTRPGLKLSHKGVKDERSGTVQRGV
jgi:hypothetical protein